MPDEQQTPQEKLKLLGEQLRAKVAKFRPVPAEVLEQALKPKQALEQEVKQEKKRLKRRRRPSR